ncbi:hypothetical protein [Boudabousia liubingyangii]|uniref:hypothetical protein n=1 Tax=Boudabousia liubingyangii TaxID=1921764 RepID=UPI000AEDBECE|nr:hypothetical protein [Boudabousia liubingyangii]
MSAPEVEVPRRSRRRDRSPEARPKPRPVRSVLSVLIVLLVVAALVGTFWIFRPLAATSGSSSLGIEVEGRPGAVLVVKLDAPVNNSQMGRHVIVSGTGRQIVAGGPVLLAVSTFDGSTGKVTGKETGPALLAGRADDELLTPDLLSGIIGATEGSRILFVRNTSTGAEKSSEIAVVDILPTAPTGKSKMKPVGAPAWVEAPYQPGKIIDVDPAKLQEVWAAQVVTGEGDQVSKGDTVIGQYLIYDPVEKKVLESTWENGGFPVQIPVVDIMAPVAAELVDSPVGSRVLTVVPANLGNGKDPLIILVDVLALVKAG